MKTNGTLLKLVNEHLLCMRVAASSYDGDNASCASGQVQMYNILVSTQYYYYYYYYLSTEPR